MQAPALTEGGTDWLVQGLRLTIFTNGFYGEQSGKWWDVVAREPFDTKTEKIKDHLVAIEGPVGVGNLVLNINGPRVDWHLTGTVSPDDFPQVMPNIGPYSEILPFFNERMSQWLPMCPPTTRMAFGAVLVLPVANRDDGYKMLQRYLPKIQMDMGNSSEFLFQINYPIDAHSVADLRINRLQKWAVALMQRFHVIAPTGVASSMSTTMGAELYGCRLEIDINTDAQRKTLLDQESLVPIFTELTELGSEIAKRGDI